MPAADRPVPPPGSAAAPAATAPATGPAGPGVGGPGVGGATATRPARSSAPRTARALLLILAYLAFVSIGFPDGLLGVGWPSIAADFGLPTEAVGFLLIAGTAGYLTSSVLAGFSAARLGIGRLLAGSTALASAALAGYALSPGLGVLAACALLLGLGSGAIDAGLNVYAASAFGPRHMNWLHAFFGLGVALGPLIMTAVLGAGLAWRWGYGVIGTAELLLAVAFAATARAWIARPAGAATGRADDPAAGGAGSAAQASADDPAAGRERVAVSVRETLALPAVWFGMLAFAVYVAIEVGAGLWAFLLLTEGRGLPATTAGACVSIYWGSLFVGRVVQGLFAERLGVGGVLRGSLVAMAVGAGLVALPGSGWLAVIGFAVLGFGAAPVFPLLTLTTVDRVGVAHADRAIGLQTGTSALGAVAIPAGIGVLIGRFGVEVLGPALLVSSLALLLLYAVANRGRPPAIPAGGRAGGRG